MAASRFQQVKEGLSTFKDYIWKKMESPWVQNFLSLTGGAGVAYTTFLIAGYFVDGGALWAITVVSGVLGTGYAKYKLHNALEIKLQLADIVPLRIAVLKQTDHIVHLHENDNAHARKQTNHYVSLLRHENAIRTLAKYAPTEVHREVMRVLSPPEDKEENLEGGLIEQLANTDRKAVPDQKREKPEIEWIMQQKLFPIASTRDVIAKGDDDDIEAMEKSRLLPIPLELRPPHSG